MTRWKPCWALGDFDVARQIVRLKSIPGREAAMADIRQQSVVQVILHSHIIVYDDGRRSGLAKQERRQSVESIGGGTAGIARVAAVVRLWTLQTLTNAYSKADTPPSLLCRVSSCVSQTLSS